MNLQLPVEPRVVTERLRDVITHLRPGSAHGRRSLPIRCSADQLRALWEDPRARAAVLDGLGASGAELDVGGPAGDWGTVATIRLELEAPLPGMAAQVLAGKAVRRLKALAEAGEVPTTDHNPSGRSDAGEPAS
jgi:hypothetical protein